MFGFLEQEGARGDTMENEQNAGTGSNPMFGFLEQEGAPTAHRMRMTPHFEIRDDSNMQEKVRVCVKEYDELKARLFAQRENIKMFQSMTEIARQKIIAIERSGAARGGSSDGRRVTFERFNHCRAKVATARRQIDEDARALQKLIRELPQLEERARGLACAVQLKRVSNEHATLMAQVTDFSRRRQEIGFAARRAGVNIAGGDSAACLMRVSRLRADLPRLRLQLEQERRLFRQAELRYHEHKTGISRRGRPLDIRSRAPERMTREGAADRFSTHSSTSSFAPHELRYVNLDEARAARWLRPR